MEKDSVGRDDRTPHPLVYILPEHLLCDPQSSKLFLYSLLSIRQVWGTKSEIKFVILFGNLEKGMTTKSHKFFHHHLFKIKWVMRVVLVKTGHVSTAAVQTSLFAHW